MKKILITIGVVIVALIIGFYALNSYIYNEKQGTGEPTPIVAENPEGEADPSRMTLGMNTWTWISAMYNDGREIKPTKAGAFTLAFGDDGKFAAATDCNGIGGTYVADKAKGTLVFSNMFSTEKYCEGSQEQEFSLLLRDTAQYHFTSWGQLILDLKFDSGSAVFR